MADNPQQAKARASLRARGEQLAPVSNRTEYVYVSPSGSGSNSGNGNSGGTSGTRFSDSSGSGGSETIQGDSRLSRGYSWVKGRVAEKGTPTIPRGLPNFLGNRRIITYSWFGAMVLVGFDEWHNNGILPRPARLWYTSLTFGLLTIAAQVDAIVPLCNALAIGFLIALGYQYFSGKGQFADSGK